MIEPMMTERQCTSCRECKPLTQFSPNQGRCKSCRSVMNVGRYRVKSKRRDEVWPRRLSESLLDIGLKKWARGVADRTRPLVGRLSA